MRNVNVLRLGNAKTKHPKWNRGKGSYRITWPAPKPDTTPAKNTNKEIVPSAKPKPNAPLKVVEHKVELPPEPKPLKVVELDTSNKKEEEDSQDENLPKEENDLAEAVKPRRRKGKKNPPKE